MTKLTPAILALLTSSAAWAQQVPLDNRPIMEVAQGLKPGEFVWEPQPGADGPILVIVNLESQRLVMFENGVAVAASTVSSGAPGHETPTGVFSILQKNKKHFSKTYNNAPMPNMQRLTWKGIALHAGNLPGYPASHGCIRLPLKFSELLFGATSLGMTVVITSVPSVPTDSGEPMAPAASMPQASLAKASYQWQPQGSPDEPLAIIVSAADQRAIVIREGKQIGSAPVRISGAVGAPTAYVLKSWDESGKHWLKLQFSGAGGSMEVSPDEAKRFDAPAEFRAAVAAAVRPGSVVVVTPEPLKTGSPGRSATVLEGEKDAR